MLLVIGLLQVIWDLRVFTQIYVLQKAGGVTRDTNLLGTYIYRLGIGGGDFGTAAAVGAHAAGRWQLAEGLGHAFGGGLT